MSKFGVRKAHFFDYEVQWVDDGDYLDTWEHVSFMDDNDIAHSGRKVGETWRDDSQGGWFRIVRRWKK